MEGTGSYGAGLARHPAGEGIEVIEVNRAARRRSGKTDAVDAEAAARTVLGGRATGAPKSKDGPVEELRVLKVVKDSAVRNRTQAINQLKALLVSAPAQLRESLAGLTNPALFKACAALDPQASAVHQALNLLAHRIKQLSVEATTLTRRIAAIIQVHSPQLLELTGVGPDSAAILLIAAGDNHDRLRDEASFAALCGVSPVERSSGKNQRRRLNRGGNRQANAALYRIVLSRLRWEERSRAYLLRRTAEGKTKREVIRCLKRYVAPRDPPGYRLRSAICSRQPRGLTSIGASGSRVCPRRWRRSGRGRSCRPEWCICCGTPSAVPAARTGTRSPGF